MIIPPTGPKPASHLGSRHALCNLQASTGADGRKGGSCHRAGLGGVIAVFNGHVYHLVLVVAQAAQRPRAFLILRHFFLDSILKDVPLRLGGSSFQNPSIDCSLHIRRA